MRAPEAFAALAAAALLCAAPPLPAQAPGFLDEFLSNRYTRPEPAGAPVRGLALDAGFSKIMESDALAIYLREATAGIRVLDRRSGYVWGGLPVDKPDDMNSVWAGIGNSLLTIDTFSRQGLERRVSLADPMVNRRFEVRGRLLTVDADFTELGIALRFEMELAGDRIVFRVVDDSVRETGDTTLGGIFFVPFLGCTRADETPGYLFVPDGSGALIRFRAPTQYLNVFQARVYGKDYAIDTLLELNDLKSRRPNDNMVPEQQVLFPVFGVVHGAGRNGLLGSVDSGAEYAEIVAYPSGMRTNYNWVSARFIYRQKYLQPTTRSGAGVQVVQQERNHPAASVSYQFLTGSRADYVGMAVLYRERLEASGMLPARTGGRGAVPLRMDVIAADLQRRFFRNGTRTVTPMAALASMVADLASRGVAGMTVLYEGWEAGGLGGFQPRRFGLARGIGGEEELAALPDLLRGHGAELYLRENLVTATRAQLDLPKEAGTTLSQAYVFLKSDNRELLFPETYYLNTVLTQRYLSQRIPRLAALGIRGVALARYGNALYAEHERGRETTRTEALAARIAGLEEVRAAGIERVAMDRPNDFLWSRCSAFLDAPLANSLFLFETDCVPFLQIVLKGAVEYYAPYANEGAYARADVLRLIEFGAYPSFLLTAADNSELRDTPSATLYSTAYADWAARMAETWREVNAVLARVEGRRITGRTVVAPGVVRVAYEGGVSVVVNYTARPAAVDGRTVAPESAAVREGPTEGRR